MTATIPHKHIGPFTLIRMPNWQWFAGPGGDYGRFVVWLGPIYIAVR